MAATVIAKSIEVVGSVTSKSSEILTPEPLEFVAGSRHATGGGRRASLGILVNVNVRVHVNVGLRAHEGRPREAGCAPASHRGGSGRPRGSAVAVLAIDSSPGRRPGRRAEGHRRAVPGGTDEEVEATRSSSHAVAARQRLVASLTLSACV